MCKASCGELGNVKVNRIWIEIDIPGISTSAYKNDEKYACWRSDLEKKILNRVIVDFGDSAKYSLNDFNGKRDHGLLWAEPMKESDRARRLQIELATCILPVKTHDFHTKNIFIEFLELKYAVLNSSPDCDDVVCTSSCLPLSVNDICAQLFIEIEDVKHEWHPHQIMQWEFNWQ